MDVEDKDRDDRYHDDDLTPLDRSDALSLQVRRAHLAKWIDGEFLVDKLPGLFIRVMIGMNKDKPIYRMAQVAGVLRCYVQRTSQRSALMVIHSCSGEKHGRAHEAVSSGRQADVVLFEAARGEQQQEFRDGASLEPRYNRSA